MLTQSLHQSLSDLELDELDDFLRDASGINLEELDGYFAALVCGPETVPPSEYLPHVLGAEFAFPDEDDAGYVIGLLMRYWNAVAFQLRLSLYDCDADYTPLLLVDENGNAQGNDWAAGFVRGMQMRPEHWNELLDDDTHGGCLIPILMLAYENDADPNLRLPPISPEKRNDTLLLVATGLPFIYRYFSRAHHAGLPGTEDDEPLRLKSEPEETIQISRCPCGSGKKYLSCCGKLVLH